MSLLTNWGYAVTNVDALPEMLEAIEYDQFTADKFVGDKRTHSNIMAAESAIRNYCGWHVFPELDCRLDTTFFDRRVTTAGRYIMIQLPATYVTAVKSIQIAGVAYDETFVLDNNGILRIYDVNMCAIREYSKIVVEYTAGIPKELAAGLKELIAHRVTHAMASSDGVQSESAGGVSITYNASWTNNARATALTDDNKEVLSPYKLKGVF
jgi:hypothetical protein